MKRIIRTVTGLMMSFVMLISMNTPIFAADLRPDFSLYVNRALDCVTVKLVNPDGTETPVKSMVCSTGRAGHVTPLGVFKTSDYYDWRLMVDGTYGRYAVRFNRGIMFHSVPYFSRNEGNLEYDQYNLLGQKASLGCVRLAVADAKWIYDNCKKGTRVIVYDDFTSPGELSKPMPITIDPTSPCRGWDPTDVNPLNPWLLGLTPQQAEGAPAAESQPEGAPVTEPQPVM
ncbi:MAG: L,D-transpeptidase [Lachnospiraceae bacterium]|nr:L,D-transpeptidase [Lachnospiraceae bacterium]